MEQERKQIRPNALSVSEVAIEKNKNKIWICVQKHLYKKPAWRGLAEAVTGGDQTDNIVDSAIVQWGSNWACEAMRQSTLTYGVTWCRTLFDRHTVLNYCYFSQE